MPNINKEMLRVLRDEINEALKAIGQRHGVTIKAGSAKFTPEAARFALDVTANSATGETQDIGAVEFKRNAIMFGLKPEDLGKQVVTGQGVYTITGLKPTSYKYPILAKSLRDGRTYKLPASTVRHALATAAAAQGGGR